LIRERLTPGRVIHLFCGFTNPAKEKFLVLASVEPGPLCFLINSRITDYITKREYLAKCQVLINREHHSFLTHDSYIDCTQCHTVGMDEIYKQLERSVDRIKDTVTDEVKGQIVAAVKFSPTLSPRHKKAILSALT